MSAVIGRYAFRDCQDLIQVELGNNSEIGEYAFTNCGSEENPVDIIFGNETIYGSHIVESSIIGTLSLPCNFAEQVPENIYPFDCTYIGWHSYSKASIHKLVIRNAGDGVMPDDRSNAYMSLSAQTEEVEFQEGVTHVGASLFSASNSADTTPSLQKVTFPSTLESVGEYAFSGCSLQDVYYSGTINAWDTVNLTNGNNTLLLARFHCDLSGLTPDFVLPISLTTVEEEAFAGNAFVYVMLSDQTISVGRQAFADCPNLTYIYIPATATQIDEQAFGNMEDLTIIGKAGSTAETYAKDHGYMFIADP